MLKLVNIVRTNQIDTVSRRSKPFPIGIIHIHAANIDAGKQIVCIVGSIVTGHLYLMKHRIGSSYLIGLKDERPFVCAYPHVVIVVFSNSTDKHNAGLFSLFVDELVE